MSLTPDFPYKYLSILRCRTWCEWPEHLRLTSRSMEIQIPKSAIVYASIHLVSYEKRRRKRAYSSRPARDTSSPLVWRGRFSSFHEVGSFIIKDPNDIAEVSLAHQRAFRGEIDVQIHFGSHGEFALADIQDIILSMSLSVVAFVNIELGELLVPVAPLQLRKLLEIGTEFSNLVEIYVAERHTLSREQIITSLNKYGGIFTAKSKTSEEVKTLSKLRTALELYSSYFYERSHSVRFLTLITALEILATSEEKHIVAVKLIDQWKCQLEELQNTYIKDTDEYDALDSLKRELLFRKQRSIRSQVRQLVLQAFIEAGNLSATDYARRAAKIYDQRSTLTHEGTLPEEILKQAEKDIKEILEVVLRGLYKKFTL